MLRCGNDVSLCVFLYIEAFVIGYACYLSCVLFFFFFFFFFLRGWGPLCALNWRLCEYICVFLYTWIQTCLYIGNKKQMVTVAVCCQSVLSHACIPVSVYAHVQGHSFSGKKCSDINYQLYFVFFERLIYLYLCICVCIRLSWCVCLCLRVGKATDNVFRRVSAVWRMRCHVCLSSLLASLPAHVVIRRRAFCEMSVSLSLSLSLAVPSSPALPGEYIRYIYVVDRYRDRLYIIKTT